MKKDSRHFSREEEEADMGIGTMIVFIAMILVSAVAAGLLLNTAYRVQQQAEETGRLAILNVATSFQIVNALGDRDPTETGTNSDTIQALEIKLGLVAGSPDTLMTNVIIEITTQTGEENLIFDNAEAYQHEWDDTSSNKATDIQSLKEEATAGTDYTGYELRDPANHFYTAGGSGVSDWVVSQGTLIRVFIDLSNNPIDTQDWVMIKVIPKHGVPTVWIGTAPEALTDRYVRL